MTLYYYINILDNTYWVADIPLKRIPNYIKFYNTYFVNINHKL